MLVLTTLLATVLPHAAQATPCRMVNPQGRNVDLSYLCKAPSQPGSIGSDPNAGFPEPVLPRKPQGSIDFSPAPAAQGSATRGPATRGPATQGQVGRALNLPSSLTPFVPPSSLALNPTLLQGRTLRRLRPSYGVILLEPTANQPAYSILQGFLGNAASTPARNLAVTYEVLNAKGTTVARGTQLVEPSTLKPGQSTNFYLTWQAIENVLPKSLRQDTHSLQFRITGIRWTTPQGSTQQTDATSYLQAIGKGHCDYAWEQNYSCLSRAGKL